MLQERDIFDERRLTEERMGALIAVGKGSVKPPRMVVLTHRGGRTSPTPAASDG